MWGSSSSDLHLFNTQIAKVYTGFAPVHHRGILTVPTELQLLLVPLFFIVQQFLYLLEKIGIHNILQ